MLRPIVLLVVVVALAVASAGCLGQGTQLPWEPPVAKKASFSLNIYPETNLEVQQGDRISFLLSVKNHKDSALPEANLSISGLPPSWSSHLLSTALKLPSLTGYSTMLHVSVPADADLGKETLKVTAKAGPGGKVSRSLAIHVVEKVSQAQVNDTTIQLRYVGYFPDGRVFDTSIEDVGTDSAVSRIADWSHGPEYRPFELKFGSGGSIAGFEEGARTLVVGQSRLVEVPPQKGYGSFTTLTIPLTQTLNLTETLSWNDFTTRYGENPSAGLTTKDPRFQWPVLVQQVRKDNVTILHQPIVGSTVRPYGWDSSIMSVDSGANGGRGTVVLQHHVLSTSTVEVDWRYHGTIDDLDSQRVVISYNTREDELGTSTLFFLVTLTKVL